MQALIDMGFSRRAAEYAIKVNKHMLMGDICTMYNVIYRGKVSSWLGKKIKWGRREEGKGKGEKGREKGREKERQVERHKERQVKREKLNSYADVRYMYNVI